jgi:hypothetical protein
MEEESLDICKRRPGLRKKKDRKRGGRDWAL